MMPSRQLLAFKKHEHSLDGEQEPLVYTLYVMFAQSDNSIRGDRLTGKGTCLHVSTLRYGWRVGFVHSTI